MIWLLASAVKVSLMIALALTATWFLRTRSAAWKHALLSAALFGAVAMPALELIAPRWSLPIGIPQQGSFDAPASDAAASANVTPAARSTRGNTAASPTATLFDRTAGLDVGRAAGVLWISGAIVLLARLMLGFGRLLLLASRAQWLSCGRSVDIAQRVARGYGLRQEVQLLQSDDPGLVATWGLRRHKVILPHAAAYWTDERLRIVLAHELAHIKRGDWIVQMVAEMAQAFYWFNPLVWVACRRLRLESELACDDLVLTGGVGGAEYAGELLELARINVTYRAGWSSAVAMASPSSLERRITAMLNARISREPAHRKARLATVVALALVALPLAGLAQETFATFSGSVFDPGEGRLPNVTLVLTNVESGAKYEIRSDPTGRFEFVGLRPGEYTLQAEYPGFRRLKGSVYVTGKSVQQDVRLDIGELEETITVDDGPPAEPRVRSAPNFKEPHCGSGRAATASGGVPIGGNIRPPMKLTHVSPQYPADLRGKVQGVVELATTINVDGTVGTIQVVASTNSDLANAAIEGVKQWRFSQTLLNCVPVEVQMRVHVRFVARS
jgi:TonB family protein